MKRLWNTRPAQPRKGSAQWVPVLGNLQKTLQKGEHLPLRPLPMFESNFVQVTEVGSPVFLHHRANRVTMGVAASLPGLVLPDILLFARPRTRDDSCLELTRMIPLDFACLHIHDTSARRLKLRLVTGRCYYLDLEAPDREMSFLFDCWVRLAHLLQEPATAWAPWPLHPSGHDVLLAKVPASTWRLQDLAHGTQTAATQEPTFPHKRPPVQKPRKAKRRFQSRAVGDSVPLFWSQQDCADVRTKSTENRSAPSANPDRRDIQIHGSGKNSNTIRTIFSIISSTIHQACTPDSEEAPGREGLIATPSRCVSRDSSGLSRLGSIDSLEILLWQHEIEDFLAPESTTLSSSSLNTAPYSPALYLFPPCPSFSSPQDKARDVDSRLGQGPPPSQKALSSAGPQRGAPVIMDKPQRVPAVSGGPQKSPASAHPFQKALTVLSPPPQSPTVLPTCTGPQKAACPQGPEKEPLFLPTWSQQTPAPLPQPQAAPSPPALQGKPPTQLDMVLAGPPGADVTKRSKHEGSPGPRVLVGIQEMNVTEIRTQEVSLDLPFGTTTKESKEVLVSQAREVTLGGLWGQAKLEDTAHRRREEVLLDLPSVRSKEVEQQKTRVRTQQVAFKGPGQERSRAFSVEGLSMAKPMIMANSKEQCPWPAMASLPSRLAGTSQAGAMSVDIEVSVPWSPSQLSLLEDTRVVVRDQPESHPCGKEQAERQMDREPPRDSGGSSKGPLSPVPGSNSPMRTADPLVPIPLPASLWEDLPQPPLPPACSSGAKAPARVPQQLTRASQGPVRMPRPHSPATARSSSESILPVLLEIPSVRDVATQAQITKGDLRLLHPLASLQPSQRFQ